LITYFETSAFVKLFIAEEGSSAAAIAWMEAEAITSSVLTYVEARAALAAARRGGRLTPDRLTAAKVRFEERWEEVEDVAATTEIVRRAGDLAEHHSLRGYDALHLSSALDADTDTFVTADQRLARAARAEGLHVSIS
jgi:uncharacterized protein